MNVTTIAGTSTSRSLRRIQEHPWGNMEDELLDGATAWQSQGNFGSERGSAGASEVGSVRVLETSDRRKKVAVMVDKTSTKSENDGNTHQDTRLSRSQPWRSRYPTPRDVEEHFASHFDGASQV